MVSKKFLRNFFRKKNKLPRKIFMYLGTHQKDGLLFQQDVADELGLPLTTLNHHITNFRQEGLLKNKLQFTDTANKLFQYIWKNIDAKILRAHNIQLLFHLKECPRRFPSSLTSIYKPITNNKYQGIKTEILGMTCMFYSSKKIVCVLKDIFGNNDEEISSAVQLAIPDIITALENQFKGIKIDDNEIARIQTMHVAVLNSVIAEKYILKGFNIENPNFAFDRSNKVFETEITNPSIALRDINQLILLEDDFREFLEWKKNKDL